MDSQKTWIEHFGVPHSTLESWQLEVPQGMPLLFWCLMESKIPFKDYAQWAKESYGLSLLNPKFFENSSSMNIKNSVEASPSWSPWHVPIAQWDGSTFVGCVEPPEEAHPSCVYVLAPPVELNEFYKQIFPEPEAISSEAEGPQGFKLDLDMPAGLNLNLEAPPPLPDFSQFEKPSEEVTTFSVPEGLNLSELSSPTAVIEDTSVDKEMTESHTQIHPSITQVSSEPSPAPKKPLSTDFNLSDWWQEAKTQFADCYILVGDVDTAKLIWKNGDSFDGSQISLTPPSLFRIAVRTQKPYHGFVVDNEIHKEFFKSLGLAKFPKTVTAISTLTPEGSFLTLLCYGFLGEDPNQELLMAEELAAKFSTSQPEETRIKKSA